ncbi:hypothetical protein ABXS75_08795 [Roseburia hominis]
MKVYFEENYWSKGMGRKPGEKVVIEKEFVWDCHEWRIPALYLCEEGVVVDLCVRIPRGEVEEFLDKWSFERRSQAEEEFNEEEIEQLERESPFCRNFRMQAELDGRKMESRGWCGTAWHPFSETEEAVSVTEEMLMREYGCSKECGWYFCRAYFAGAGEPKSGKPSSKERGMFRQNSDKSSTWERGMLKQNSSEPPFWREEEGRKNSHNLAITFEKEAEQYPGPHFCTRAGDRGSRIRFTYPGDGQVHVLQVVACEQGQVNETSEHDKCLGKNSVTRFPANYLELYYTLEPELPEDSLFIKDLVRSDPPELKRQNSIEDAEVSVIGGADGPTAVFLAGKWNDGRPKDHIAYPRASRMAIRPFHKVYPRASRMAIRPFHKGYSSLHYEPVESVEWRMVFRVKEESGMEVQLNF